MIGTWRACLCDALRCLTRRAARRGGAAGKSDLGVEAEADSLHRRDRRRLLAGLLGGGAQVAAKLGDAGVERILAGRLVVWLFPDRQEAAFTRADRAGVISQMQQQA